MSNSQNHEALTPEPQWQVEYFYFGNFDWPSDRTYRTNGEQIQYRVEKVLPLTLHEGTSLYDASADNVAEFLAQYLDCQFIVADSYDVLDGSRQAPYLWLIGWKELSEEERHIYEEDKADAW